MNQDLKNKVLGGVVTAAVLGGLAFLWDLNTTDPEVLPTVTIQQDRLEVQQKQLEIQQQAVEELEEGTDAIARYVVQSEIKNLSELIRMFENRRDQWNEIDRDQYQRLQQELRDAYNTLEKINETE